MSDDMIQSVSSVFERELRRLIAEERNHIAEVLVGGHSIKSMEEYREAVGKVAALDLVIELCDDAQKVVNKTL
jgi:hypothetical protein